ncbi:siderophore-interacting protein [Kineococcus aurantiacus]|uniref:NADPH-dependent ferric siderophore reductase n=1 Tax=Kineococcus aurantiacus TaxID=37633 RepID=A0A7Y9DML9_9ACTN|nr:siderophore-interacting protein [Kineococcus aurantiacus]NYD23266.1 NADPH-dependent ferric siderophore reductase [Kineococcus aurantiacus]
MSTDTGTAARGTRTRPRQAAYGLFEVQVAAVQRLGASFVRLTFTSPELAGFGAGGYDQRIKLLLLKEPFAAHDVPGDDWYTWWRELPEDVRPTMRTYTVRAFRPATAHAQAELDVDFVLHGVQDGQGGHAGPASRWAAEAVVGDALVLVGPTAPGGGRAWGVEWAPPAEARTLLLAGDETAVPAVSAILEQLPAGVKATALLEVPSAGDLTGLLSEADLTVEWLPRNGSHAPGELLQRRVHEVASALVDEVSAQAAPGTELEDVDLDAGILWEVPEHAVASGPQALYAWLAGECGVVKALRRHLVREVGVPRTSVAFMGYWREGRAEGE